MSGRYISFLIVLVNIYLVRTEVIHGVEIPDLDVKKVLGKWYVIFGPSDDSYIACMRLTVEQPSEEIVKLTAKVTPTPEGVAENRSYANEPILAPMKCRYAENSQILKCNNINNQTVATVVFDTDYDSYMAAYVAIRKEDLNSNHRADVYLLSRTLTLPSETIDKIKDTDFYRQKSFPKYEVFHLPASCLE